MQLFEFVLEGGITAQNYFISLGIALVCGLITALASAIKSNVTKSFMISLVALPMVVLTVITMVNKDAGTGIAVLGAFSLIRFRSVPGKARDIAFIFLTMTAGIGCASGYIYLTLAFIILVCAVIVILTLLPIGNSKTMDLQITIPESLHFTKEFEDLFEEYTKKHRLVKTKTSNMGSLYVLYFKIVLKDVSAMQEFMDKLRCRNGNLEISISESPEGADEL